MTVGSVRAASDSEAFRAHMPPGSTGVRAPHPGPGERLDRGPDHYRGSEQGETRPAEGDTPTPGPRTGGRPCDPTQGDGVMRLGDWILLLVPELTG